MKSMLNGIRMKYIGNFEGKNSCTALLGILIKSIFCVHLFSIKNTKFLFKSWAIQGHESSKHLCLNLKRKLIQCISVKERPFLRRVSMKVKIVKQPLRFTVMTNKVLHAIYGRLP